MNTLSKVLLGIYAVILAAVSLFVMLITVWPGLFRALYDHFTFSVLDNRTTSLIFFLVALLLFILSLVFIVSMIRIRKTGRSIVRKTELGETLISLAAIENIGQATVKKIPSVRESHTSCHRIGDSDKVAMTLRVVVLSDASMPALSEEIQHKVKKAVEDTTGIAVQDIRVLIDNIHSVMKARVE